MPELTPTDLDLHARDRAKLHTRLAALRLAIQQTGSDPPPELTDAQLARWIYIDTLSLLARCEPALMAALDASERLTVLQLEALRADDARRRAEAEEEEEEERSERLTERVLVFLGKLFTSPAFWTGLGGAVAALLAGLAGFHCRGS